MSTQQPWNYRIGRNEERVFPEHHWVDVRRLGVLTLAGLLFFVIATPVLAGNGYDRRNADGNQLIVRGAKADIEQIAAQHRLMISGHLENADGYGAVLESDALTVSQVEDLLLGDSRVSDFSRVQLASLPVSAGISPASQDISTDLSMAGDFSTPCLAEGFAGLVWSGYANQEAVRDVRLHRAQANSTGCGRSAVVAVIDTGVDPNQPLLEGALMAGYDFILETAGIPSEWSTFEKSVAESLEDELKAQGNQSREAVFGGSGNAWPDLSIAAIVEIGLQGHLESTGLSYFGHGTMVAGLVRVAAPNALIMPLRVFDGHGNAHLFDIIRAIYYAVDNGADVINMSFSVDDTSMALRRAIRYARDHGVVCVGAAGNQGLLMQNFPASYASVIAVASVDDGLLSPFSNYGSSLVDLAAPGTGVVSAYPGGLYAVGWGTSFSAPLVSGTVALLMNQYPEKRVSSVQAIKNDLKHGSDKVDGLNGLIGSGLLNALATVLEAQK